MDTPHPSISPTLKPLMNPSITTLEINLLIGDYIHFSIVCHSSHVWPCLSLLHAQGYIFQETKFSIAHMHAHIY